MKGMVSGGIGRRHGSGSSFRGSGGMGVYAKSSASPVSKYARTLLISGRNTAAFIGEPGNAHKQS